MNPQLQKDDLPTKISGLLGIATIGVAIWGAVITWPHVGCIFSGCIECNGELRISGFISSAIPLAIVVLMLIGAIVEQMCMKREGADGHHAEMNTELAVPS